MSPYAEEPFCAGFADRAESSRAAGGPATIIAPNRAGPSERAQVLRRWKDQVAVDARTAFPGHGRVRGEDAEVQRLRHEVAQLRAERDFLKKTAAYFARETR